MTCFAKIKCYASCFFVFYFLYLFVYKCPSSQESFLEHAVGKVIHPLSHSHNKLCEVVDTASEKATPYVSSASNFFEKKVQSHQLFKQYLVDAKVNCAKANYYKHVHPYVIKLFQLFEIAEYHISVKVSEIYAILVAQYHKVVVPKVVELKGQAEAAKEHVEEAIKSKLD